MAARLNLLVIRTADLGLMAAWYGNLLGQTGLRECHATGPEHVAFDFGSTVLELYPLGETQTAAQQPRQTFGLAVDRPTFLRLSQRDLPDVGDSPLVRLVDPDGNRVLVAMDKM